MKGIMLWIVDSLYHKALLHYQSSFYLQITLPFAESHPVVYWGESLIRNICPHPPTHPPKKVVV